MLFKLNPTRNRSVLQEFFNQGDLEKKAGLPVSMLMDRNTTNIAKMQIGLSLLHITNINCQSGSQT